MRLLSFVRVIEERSLSEPRPILTRRISTKIYNLQNGLPCFVRKFEDEQRRHSIDRRKDTHKKAAAEQQTIDRNTNNEQTDHCKLQYTHTSSQYDSADNEQTIAKEK